MFLPAVTRLAPLLQHDGDPELNRLSAQPRYQLELAHYSLNPIASSTRERDYVGVIDVIIEKKINEVF